MARNSRRNFDDDFSDFSGKDRSGNGGGRGGRNDDFDDFDSKNPMDDYQEPRGTFNIAMLLVSFVLAPVIWPVSLFLYDSVSDSFPRVLLIGLIFGLLGLAVGLVVHLVSKIARTFQKNLSPARGAIPVVVTILLASLLMGILSGGFQWLYQTRFQFGGKGPTSYIFVIDNSGSMKNSDPYDQRYASISKLLENMDDDFPFMVYGFEQQAYIIRDMAPVSEGTTVKKFQQRENSATFMKQAMENVIADYENGLWDGGARPQVILLTDGEVNDTSDFSHIGQLDSVLKKYIDNGITISTVGLVEYSEDIMSAIAEKTGGIFVEVGDASQLLGAMSSAVNIKTTDDLVNTRKDGGLLFGALRALFITILGTLLAYIKAVAYGQSRAYKAIIIGGAGQSLVGALIIELGTSLIGFEYQFCWLLAWFVLILMICNKYERFAEPKKRRRVGSDF